MLIGDTEHCYLLEHEYHHRFHVPVHDEELDAQWCIWILRRYLLLWLVIRGLLLPRVQGYATGGHSRGL